MTDDRDLRRVFGLLTTGVTVVTAVGPGPEPVGVTANSVTSVSLDPPLILWCLANKSNSIGAFTLGSPFAIHILAAHQADIALHFARSGQSKFEAGDYARSHPVLPDVEGALARIECRVDALHGGGDHTIIVGAVTGWRARSGAPLAFYASRFGGFDQGRGAGDDEVWSQARDVWT